MCCCLYFGLFIMATPSSVGHATAACRLTGPLVTLGHNLMIVWALAQSMALCIISDPDTSSGAARD